MPVEEILRRLGSDSAEQAWTAFLDSYSPLILQVVRDEITIAARAYELWQEQGCPIGSSETDWLRAEEALKKQTAA